MTEVKKLKEVTNWLSRGQIDQMYSSEYWNNITDEKNKPWWILDGNYKKLWAYLENSGTLQEFNEGINEINSIKSKNINIADLAAGTGWTSAILSKIDSVSEVHSLEMSEHRISELFAETIKMFDGNPDKIHRYLGSFYETQFKNNYFDIIVLNQAFHHADEPFALLQECKRILKKEGSVFIIGEPYIGFKAYLRKIIATIVKERKLKYKFYDLFETCPEMGDHYYRDSDYRFIFQSAGFECSFKLLKTGNGFYILKNL